MTDTYQDWVDRVAGGRSAKPLSSGEIVKSSSGEPFGTVEFIPVMKKWFKAEVGKKGKTYIYHFFPLPQFHPVIGPDNMMSQNLVEGTFTTFYDAMTRAFLEVFKREDQVEASWVEEMKAWAVRVHGWTDNVWGDELALRAIDRLDEILRGEKL
jgi:hypothetical protein